MPPELVDEFSAYTYLLRDGAMFPPMLVVKAGKDSNAGINPSISRFVEKAEELKAPVTLLTHPTGAHAFDIQGPDNTTIRIMRTTLDYFLTNLD